MQRVNLQSREHVARTDAVDPDTRMCPLDCQTGSQMPYSRLGRVVWCLRLRHVHNGARHAANEYDASRCLSLHQMFRDTNTPKVGAVHIHLPQLLHTVIWVRYGIVVFGESGRCDEVVDLAMLADNVGETVVHACRA